MNCADQLERPASRRIGHWVLNDESTRYGEAGWHLDGGPIAAEIAGQVLPGSYRPGSQGRSLSAGQEGTPS